MRNQRMDLFKCLAIYSVVLLHLKSGVQGWDWPVTGLTRFAVPYFFLVSGYFAHSAGERNILRRARHALALWLCAVGVVIALRAAMVLRHPGWPVWGYFRQQFTPQAWLDLLLTQCLPLPYSYHLWFIGSLPILYLIWWGVLRVCRAAGREAPCRALAAAAVLLLGIHLFFQEGLILLGREAPPVQYLRNAWLDGLPFFLLGAWARRDGERIVSALRGGIILGGIVAGSAMALVEQYFAGYRDLFAGTILAALMVMAAALKWPEVKRGPVRRWMCFCGGSLTFYIYAIHVPLLGVLKEWSYVRPFGWMLERHFVTPLAVAVASTALALILLYVKGLWSSLRGQTPLRGA